MTLARRRQPANVTQTCLPQGTLYVPNITKNQQPTQIINTNNIPTNIPPSINDNPTNISPNINDNPTNIPPNINIKPTNINVLPTILENAKPDKNIKHKSY